jgi:hypothetical protein
MIGDLVRRALAGAWVSYETIYRPTAKGLVATWISAPSPRGACTSTRARGPKIGQTDYWSSDVEPTAVRHDLRLFITHRSTLYARGHDLPQALHRLSAPQVGGVPGRHFRRHRFVARETVNTCQHDAHLCLVRHYRRTLSGYTQPDGKNVVCGQCGDSWYFRDRSQLPDWLRAELIRRGL